MPTNVLPSWAKYLLVTTVLATGWWYFSGSSVRSVHRDNSYLTSTSSAAGNGLPGKVVTNIRQFVTNPLEPTSLPDEGAVILRDTGTNYYRNEP